MLCLECCMSVNRLNFGDLAPAPSASMTRTTHSKKPHVHRCVSGCVNNFGVRSGNQRAVSCGRTGSPLSTAVPWCVARCRAVTALRRSRTPCCLAPPKRFITRMGCHRPRQPGCQPLYMGRTAAGNNRLVDEPAPRPSGRAQ